MSHDGDMGLSILQVPVFIYLNGILGKIPIRPKTVIPQEVFQPGYTKYAEIEYPERKREPLRHRQEDNREVSRRWQQGQAVQA